MVYHIIIMCLVSGIEEYHVTHDTGGQWYVGIVLVTLIEVILGLTIPLSNVNVKEPLCTQMPRVVSQSSTY